MGIEVPPGAPRLAALAAGPSLAALVGPSMAARRAARPHVGTYGNFRPACLLTLWGPAATAPPRCHPLRALRWGFGLYGRTSPRHTGRARSGPGCRRALSQNFSERAPPTVKVLARSHRRLPHTHSRLFLSPRRDVPCVLGSHHSQ